MMRAELIESDSEHTEMVLDSLDRMETMIEKLLRLARAGQDVEITEECRLENVVQSGWTTLQTEDSELRTSVEDESVEADPTRLLQVFENLFRNAIEHNDGPVVIRVGLLENSDGFYVEDDGQGIPETARANIFEQGYTSSGTGSGFGLAIVSDIVDAHDWEITVASGTDDGARFEVRTD